MAKNFTVLNNFLTKLRYGRKATPERIQNRIKDTKRTLRLGKGDRKKIDKMYRNINTYINTHGVLPKGELDVFEEVAKNRLAVRERYVTGAKNRLVGEYDPRQRKVIQQRIAKMEKEMEDIRKMQQTVEEAKKNQDILQIDRMGFAPLSPERKKQLTRVGVIGTIGTSTMGLREEKRKREDIINYYKSVNTTKDVNPYRF
jgi:hypothetical protein